MANPPDGDQDGDAAMRARLTELSGALENRRRAGGVRAGQPTGSAGPNGMGQAVSMGFRVMSEFVAAVAVGGVVGWAIDRWLGSSPAALIVFIGLGTAAGFWNVYRVAVGPGAPRR